MGQVLLLRNYHSINLESFEVPRQVLTKIANFLIVHIFNGPSEKFDFIQNGNSPLYITQEYENYLTFSYIRRNLIVSYFYPDVHFFIHYCITNGIRFFNFGGIFSHYYRYFIKLRMIKPITGCSQFQMQVLHRSNISV